MQGDEPAEGDYERRLDAIIAEYYRLADAGGVADQNEFIRRNPDFASELKDFFSDVQLLHSHDHLEPDGSRLDATTAHSTSRLSRPATRPVVRYFGGYELLEELGAGGMGVVYKARQIKLKRIVALKMIRAAQLANTLDSQRFEAEARAAAKLSHPGIVSVHEVGVHDGHHFYTMDYVEGGNLSQLYREESVPAKQAAKIVFQLAESMHYAHLKGIVHRDLKPANILLTVQGEPRITDFGLAKCLRDDEESQSPTMTESGQILGTAGYMSPEQASGKSRLVGPSSDVYSLGAVLYALLTSRAPFVGETPSHTILQVLQNEPISPRKLNSSVPRDLETICLKCLTKEPHKRYGSAQLLADDLKRFLDHRPVLACPISRPASAWRWCRRNPWIAGLSAAMVASLLIGASVSSVLAVVVSGNYTESERQRQELATAKDWIQKSLDDLEKKESERIAALEEARWQLYRLRITRMEQLWREKDWSSLELLLAESAPALGEKDLRGWEWHFLNAQVAQRFWRVNQRPDDVTSFDWDRITGRLAVWVPNKVEIWLPGERRLLKTIDVPDSNDWAVVTWSPDHRRLAVGTANLKVHVVDTTTGGIECTLSEPDAWSGDIGRDSNKNYLSDIHWNPEGDCVAVTRAHERIRLWKLTPNPQMIALLDAPGIAGHGPRWIHWIDDNICITISTWGDMLVWETAGWKPIRRENVVRGYCHDASWSPDGKHVALASARVVIADAEGTHVKSLPDQGTWVEKLCWLDNERLVTGNAAHEFRVVHVSQSVPDQVYRLHTSKIQKVCVGPDELIASAAVGDLIRVWSPGETTAEYNVLKGAENLPSEALACAWHPTQNMLAIASPTVAASWSPADAEAIPIPFAEAATSVQWNAKGDALTLEHQSGVWTTHPWPFAGATPIVDSPPEMGSLRAYSADRRFRVQSGADWWNIGIVDLQGEFANTVPNSGDVYTFAWHPHEPWIAVAGHGWIDLFDPTRKPPKHARFGYSDRLQGARLLTWSRNGDKLLVGSDSSTVHVFDGATLEELSVLRGHTGQVSAVAWSHDNQRIVSAGRDGYIRWWDAARGIELFKIPVEEKAAICELRISADGHWLAGRIDAGKIYVWTSEVQANAAPTTPAVEIPANPAISWSPGFSLPRTVQSIYFRLTGREQPEG